MPKAACQRNLALEVVKAAKPETSGAGRMLQMQELYGEGVASHTGPVSCGTGRKARLRSVDRGNYGPGR